MAGVCSCHSFFLNKTRILLQAPYVSKPPSLEQILSFLNSPDWQALFSESSLTLGRKLARGKKVISPRAEYLDTSDLEITSQVMDQGDQVHQCSIVFWQENEAIQLDSSCSCDVRFCCPHCAATLEYLTKSERLATALGDTPHAGISKQGQHLQLDSPGTPIRTAAEFMLRVQRRGPTDPPQLPEIFATASVTYDGFSAYLDPSGILPPIVTPERKIPRERESEMSALQLLYALDLHANAWPQPAKKTTYRSTAPSWMQETPPQVTTPPRYWFPDKKAWPHPEFYWLRFRHEGTQALEKRGWSVTFAADVGHKPLVFHSSAWRAEMVEEAKGWFHLSAGFEIDGESFELQPILAALLENHFLEATEGMPKGQEFMIFLPDGRGLVLPVGRFRNILKTLGELLEFKFTDGPIKLSKLEAALLSSDEDIELVVPNDLEQLAEKLEQPQRIPSVAVPNSLNATLRHYQLEGFYWMQFLTREGFGGILADDMGLGKTLQTLAHLLAEKESGRSAGLPSLVLAPTSVVVNWQREAKKFAPSLKILILQGSARHRHFAELASYDLVLTSYALIHRDLKHHLEQPYYLTILDEAQHIKNPSAQVSQAIRQLSSRHRLCLSGTPIENNLGELWSLFAFLMPGLLGKLSSFNETYRNPIEKNKDREKLASLNRKVSPLILRRTKNDVAKELPPKTEILHDIALTSHQKDLYETVRSAMDKQVRQAIIARGGSAQIVFLDALLKLRQICCHPDLVQPSKNSSEPSKHRSAKFHYLLDLLETLLAEHHRVLIFSQFTSMLSMIEDHLIQSKISYLKLTGASQNRQELVERFQGGEADIFLISLKAGGTGLTLTGADTVIHYDPWWNPAAENQATDRAYRIGQDKPVFVHKLICTGTVEERIQQMQHKKNTLAGNILEGAMQTIQLDEDLVNELLAPDSSITDEEE